MNFFKKYKTPLLVVGGVVLFIGVLRYFNLEQQVFEHLKENREMIQDFVFDYYILSVLGYMLAMIGIVGFGIPVSIPFSVAGGFLFGGLLGGIYTLIAVVTGAVCSFLAVRYFFGAAIQKKYGSQLKKFNDDINKYGHTYILTLNLLPLTPFMLINMFAGLSSMSVFTFMWTTALGILPANFVYTFAGKELAEIDNVKDILSPEMLYVLLGLSAMAIGAMLLQRYRGRKKS